MSGGTVAVPIAPFHRPTWHLHLSAFATAMAAAKAVLADGAPLAAARYAARRHQAHPVWAAWAVARAQADLGFDADATLPNLTLAPGHALPLAIPERPGWALPDLAWPDGSGTWGLDWDEDRLLLTLAGPRVAPHLPGSGRTRRHPAGLAGRLWPAVLGLPVLLGPGLAQEAPASAGGQETYDARRGDTLRRVAERIWGEPKAWPWLWQANRAQIPNPGFIDHAVRLEIPDRSPVAVPLPEGPYRVRSGDTLWAIAGQLYGDSWAWPLLWGANRSLVRDPHWIYPDQALGYPTAGELHVVLPGESLWVIAERHYGSGRAWRRLWQANRGWLSAPEGLPAGARIWVPAEVR